jgi:uncharacterized protein
MNSVDIVINQTKKWVTDVVVACNFCPFAGREVKRGSIFYEVAEAADTQTGLELLAALMKQMEEADSIETALLILPGSFQTFDSYLSLLDLADQLVEKEGYEGIYQVASFHPRYLFAGSTEDDPSNYTNRSPYPMLHILREASVSRAVDSHPDVDAIPETNISFTREKGLHYMQQLLASCM